MGERDRMLVPFWTHPPYCPNFLVRITLKKSKNLKNLKNHAVRAFLRRFRLLRLVVDGFIHPTEPSSYIQILTHWT